MIATKVGSQMGADPNQQGLSRAHIMQAVEASLRRLQTDFIDLYQAHVDDLETPQDETMRAFDDLVHHGKARYLGASNFSAWRVTCALWESDRRGYARYACVQPPYTLANRATYERDLQPCCRELGLGVMTYSSLASGFLTGKYRPGKDLPATARAQGIQKRYMNEKGSPSWRRRAGLDPGATWHHCANCQRDDRRAGARVAECPRAPAGRCGDRGA